MAEKLGLKEVVAMGVGGMVSGGIYAVLGVAMQQAGNAVPISYLLAGLITLLTAYSYIKLTLHFGEEGGAFSFIEHAIDNRNIAGFFGWMLLVGYVGMMAMYSFAFGSYLLLALEKYLGMGLPIYLRPVFSVGMIAAFVGLNLVGVKETGLLEDLTVYFKVFVLSSLAFLGTVFYDGKILNIHLFNHGLVSPVSGFAIIFISYAGFQLISYDYRDIRNVERNLPLGMLVAILIAITIYVSVSFMASLHLTPEQLIQHKETALAKAVSAIPIIGEFGFFLVIISALKSTSSGINATLFGSSRLAHKIATEKELPRVFSFRDREGIPVYALLIMGGLTALFSVLGTLEQITQFGSVAFLIASSAANFANLKICDRTDSHPVIPLLGLLGTLIALPIILYHLLVTDLHVFLNIVGIFTALLLFETLYIERGPIEREAKKLEDDVEKDIDKLESEATEIEKDTEKARRELERIGEEVEEGVKKINEGEQDR